MEIKSIRDWYQGKSIFITGGTGYMGKVLLEKLLWSIPGINKIYVLIRPKRELLPKERLASLENIPLFQRIKNENVKLLQKLIPIMGDLGEDNLGISESDKQLLINEVSIVFHLGATLKLEANVKDAVKLNVEGTLFVLKLCKEFKQLKVFVHVSTAFCHSDVGMLKEKVYPSTKNPYDTINLCGQKTVAEITAMESCLMIPHPNSYIFSKRLAETLVDDMKHDLPVVIARPSIVLPTISEPFPGWVDSLNGPIGVVVAAGKGVLRTMYCNENNYLKVIPVDVAANSLINIAYRRTIESTNKIPVYNITSGNLLTYKDVLEVGRRSIFEYPYEWTIWFPDGQPTMNRFIHNLIIIFLHYLPAYLIDFLLLLFLQKRFMVRVQNKISLGLHFLEYFTARDWNFVNDKGLALEEGLSKEERQIFPTSSKMNDDLIKYMKNCLYGSRIYCLKESPKTLPFCRIYIRFLYCLHIITKVVIYYYLLKILLTIVGIPYLLNPTYLLNILRGSKIYLFKL